MRRLNCSVAGECSHSSDIWHTLSCGTARSKATRHGATDSTNVLFPDLCGRRRLGPGVQPSSRVLWPLDDQRHGSRFSALMLDLAPKTSGSTMTPKRFEWDVQQHASEWEDPTQKCLLPAAPDGVLSLLPAHVPCLFLTAHAVPPRNTL